jgi:signal transduction histidine kinase
MPGVTSWSLRRRLAVAVSVLATILIGLVVVAAVLLLQVRSQQRKVIDRYFTAVSVSNTRFIEQVDTETGIRGYALTGDQVMLQPTKEFGSPKYVAEATKMRTLLRGDPTTIASFDAWDRAAQKWYTDWAAPTIAEVVTNGGDSVTTQQVLAGKTLFDANRAAFGAFAHQLVERRNSASHALQLRTTLLFAAVLLVTIGVGLAGAASWWTLRLWVLVPLASLGAEARLVKSGALDHEVTVEGPAEVRAVADDVEAMRREIVEQLAEVERARVEIESARIRLEKQAAELSRSNRDLEQFAYVASHDLQEPLRKVASFCQMLERRYSGQLDERADQYIAFAVDGAKRMQQLINDLLAFSRVGRQAGSFVEVDLQDCLEQALDNLSVVIRASDAQVRADSLPHVLGDAGLLSQLLQNLIGN